MIDGYTRNSTLTSGGSVPLGTQLILVCQVVGLPYGTPPNYTWTCPNGQCEVEGDYGRKIHNERILAVNLTTTSHRGTYTCQVTATGGQQANANFTLGVTGMSLLHYSRVMQHRAVYWSEILLFYSQHSGGSVVHSEGRLIPSEFPITDLQQISDPDGIGMIRCTFFNGTLYNIPIREAINGGMYQTTVLVVDTTSDSYRNRDLYCNSNVTIYFYLYINSSSNSE